MEGTGKSDSHYAPMKAIRRKRGCISLLEQQGESSSLHHASSHARNKRPRLKNEDIFVCTLRTLYFKNII